MKKRAFVILFSVLFFSSMLSAVEFSMKQDFSRDETLSAKISGNFFEQVSENNVIFFKDHVRISLIPVVKKIDGDFYIYTQLFGKSPGNYSIMVENAKYYVGNQIVEQDLANNFTINKNFSDFSINPGFVLSEKNFSIEIQNFRDYEISISREISNNSGKQTSGFFDSFLNTESSTFDGSAIKIKSGETKKIIFDKDDFSPFTLQKVELRTNNTSYVIPVYIISNKTKINSTEAEKIKFEQSEINISMSLNSDSSRTLYLSNFGDVDLDDVEISISDSLKPYVEISEETISSIETSSSETIELSITSGDSEGSIEGQITAKTLDGNYAYVYVFLNFIEDYKPSDGDLTIPLCSEINGIICLSGQTCSGESQTGRDGVCCLGMCSETEKSNYGRYIGGAILILLVAVFFFFYFRKYRRVNNKVDLLKVAKGK